jgi:transposase
MENQKTYCYWVGLDVGKREFSAAVELSDENRNVKLMQLPAKTFKNKKNGIKNFLKWVDEIVPTGYYKVIMESTGVYSINLCKQLQDMKKGLHFSIVNPRLTCNFIKSLNAPHKTDLIDARALARYGFERKPEQTILPSKKEAEVKELTRQRTKMVATRTAYSNRSETIDSEVVAEINRKLVEELDKGIKKLDKLIQKSVMKISWAAEQVKLMQTVPGVGPVVATSLIAEMGDFTKFTRKQVSSFTGLSPILRKSGTSVNSSSLSKHSSKRIRQVLFLASNHAIRKIPLLRAKYDRLFARGKLKMTAKCACMRELAQIIRSVVVNNCPYSDEIACKSLAKSLKSA